MSSRPWPRVSAAAFLALVLTLMCLTSRPAMTIEIDPDLLAASAAKAQGEMLDVLVLMDASIDAAQLEQSLQGADPRHRRRTVVRFLKAHATATQAEILEELEAARASGEIRRLRSLWLTNVIAFTGNRAAIERLASSKTGGWAIEDKHFPVIQRASRASDPAASPPNSRPTGDTPASDIPASDVPGSHATRAASVVWSVEWIRAPEVWDRGYDGTGVVVGHLDSGVWLEHPDIANRLWVNAGEIPANGIDDDGNGYVDDVHGYDFGDDDSDPTDDGWDFAGGGHGTHTAGTVCGDGTNGIRTGVAPGATVIVCKAARTEDGLSASSDIWEGQQYAIEMGAHLLTMSLGAVGELPLSFLQAERYAGDALRLVGVPLFTSSGNAHTFLPTLYELTGTARVPSPWNPDPSVPYSSRSGVISVGASAYLEDSIWEFSSQGPADWSQVRPWNDWNHDQGHGLLKPDISAPGMGISSLRRPDTYTQTNWNGTSMACPHAAGVAALLLQKNPALSPEEIDRILQETAVDVGDPGKDNVFGSGRIDALAAIDAVPASQLPSLVVRGATWGTESGDDYFLPGEDFDLVLEVANNSFVVDANPVDVEIAVDDPMLTVLDGQAQLPPIAPGSSVTLSAGDLRLTASPSAAHGREFTVEVTLTAQGGYINVIDLSFFVGLPEWRTHESGNVRLTVTDRSTLGFWDLDQLEGSGFGPIDGPNLLYTGSFWGGAQEKYVCNRDYVPFDRAEWNVSTSPVGRVAIPSTELSDRDFVAIFEDGGHPNPRGIQVTQRSMTWTDPEYDDFVILDYEIRNTGASAVPDYRAGVFCDWDLYYPFYTRAGTDPSRNMAYVYEVYIAGDYCGVVLLEPTTASNVTVIHNPTYVHPNLQILDSDKWQLLTGAITAAEGADDDDYSTLVATGPFELASQSKVNVVFALVWGQDLADLQRNADAARKKWESTSVPVLLQDFAAHAAGSAVELEWRLASVDFVRGYRILRRDALGRGDSVSIHGASLLAPQTRSFVDSSIQMGQSYEYQLVVVQSDGSETLSREVRVDSAPSRAALLQNQPNPFNPRTTIFYRVELAGPVRLTVFDLSGRKLRSLIDEPQEPGDRSMVWDGTDDNGRAMASGMYLYRLETSGRSYARKMVLLR